MADPKDISNLIADLETDESLAAALGEMTTLSGFLDVAAGRGYVVTAAQLEGAVEAIPLSDQQLELVSGGGSDYQYPPPPCPYCGPGPFVAANKNCPTHQSLATWG